MRPAKAADPALPVLRTAALATAAVLAFMALEVLVWRPGWAIGDETLLVRKILELASGGPWIWHWSQASLHHAAMAAWASAVRPWMGGLHLPGLGLMLSEVALVGALARRWWGRETAAWAVVALVVAAPAWMSWRSLQPFAAAPFVALAVLWLGIRLRGRGQALALGLVAGVLALEYEIHALAMLVLAPLAWSKEAALRAWGGWLLAAAGATALALVLADAGRLADYSAVRVGIYAGGGAGKALQGLGMNLRELFLGGQPLPSVAVARWPALPPWTWPALGLGAWMALRREPWLLAAALVLVCVPLMSQPLWGFPGHRLHGAAPALAWLTGLGLQRLRHRFGAKPLLVLALLGLLAEGHAWARHMGLHGRQAYGRAELMAQAMRQGRAEAQAHGLGFSTALYRILYPEAGFFGPAIPGSEGSGWLVLLPPQVQDAASWAPLRVFRSSSNDEPVLLAGPLPGGRWAALESELRPLTLWSGGPAAQAERDQAWMAAAPRDPLALALVLTRSFQLLWRGTELPEGDHIGWLQAAAQASPAPEALLGRFMIGRDPQKALALLDRVLARWPDYVPALDDRAKALRELGRGEEALEARNEAARRLRAGAWMIYD